MNAYTLVGPTKRYEISVEGPLREHYLIGFLDTDDPGQWETEIGWPIFRSAS